MTDAEQAYIDGLVQIANHPKVIAACEPYIAFPQDIKEWQVIRILKAQELLLAEASKSGKVWKKSNGVTKL